MSELHLKPYNLIAPQSYLDATPKEKEEVCNGAGPRKFGWLVPDTLYLLSITIAANIHDWMYHKRWNKDKADRVFLMNMLRIIDAETTDTMILGRLLRCLRHKRALKYFEAVSQFGQNAYEDSKQR